MAVLRIALLTIRIAMRIKAALFFTFLFPLIFLFAYAGLFAHGNPQAVAYMFGPVVTLNIMGSGFWGLGLQAVMQRERGSLRRYRLAPIGPGTIVLSNLLANYLLQLPSIALLVLCARVFFHMPFKTGWLTFFILVTVGSFAFAGFGLTIASLANTMQEAQIYNNLVWITLLFLSGTTIPLPMLPHWIQRLATFLPATYLVSAFQAVMLQAQPLSDHLPEMVALGVSGSFGLLLAWKLFRWEKEETIPTRRKLWSLSFVIPFLLIGLWMNIGRNPVASWGMVYALINRGGSGSTDPGGPGSGHLIEGFENASSSEDLLKTWRLRADRVSPGRSLAELSLVSPGAQGTQHALRLGGRLAIDASTETEPLTATANLALPVRAGDLHGIEFWVRGDPRPYQITVSLPIQSPGLPPGVRFIPSNGWQLVRLPLAGETVPGPDSEAGQALGFRIEAGGPPGDFSIEVDEIRAY